MKYDVPRVGILEFDTIVLDLNGTLSVKWMISDETKEKISRLRELGFTIYLLTGDARWTGQTLCDNLWIDLVVTQGSKEKAAFMKKIGKEKTVAIGNARIDIGMFQNAALSIATIQSEWIHTAILEHVDIIIPNIEDALDLFIDWDSLRATMII